MLEGPESPKSPHKLVLPENVSISAFYTVILGRMDSKVAKLVNLAQNGTCRPLIRPIVHQRVMLESPETPKIPNKLVQPEKISISAFYTDILVAQGGKIIVCLCILKFLTPPTYLSPLLSPLKHYDISMEYTRETTNIPKGVQKLVINQVTHVFGSFTM